MKINLDFNKIIEGWAEELAFGLVFEVSTALKEGGRDDLAEEFERRAQGMSVDELCELSSEYVGEKQPRLRLEAGPCRRVAP